MSLIEASRLGPLTRRILDDEIEAETRAAAELAASAAAAALALDA